MLNRRGLLIGLGAALAAPTIVKAESLMKIAVLRRRTPVLLGFALRTVRPGEYMRVMLVGGHMVDMVASRHTFVGDYIFEDVA